MKESPNVLALTQREVVQRLSQQGYRVKIGTTAAPGTRTPRGQDNPELDRRVVRQRRSGEVVELILGSSAHYIEVLQTHDQSMEAT